MARSLVAQIKAVRRRARRLGLEVIERTPATAPTAAAVPAQEGAAAKVTGVAGGGKDGKK
jgi:hypothetical protein